MKTRYILPFLVFVNCILFGQNWTLTVKLKSNDTIIKNELVKNVRLNNLVENNPSLTGFRPCYPNARNPELATYYTLSGVGDIKRVTEELSQSGMFGAIQEDEVAYTLTCTDPCPSVNDSCIVHGLSDNYGLDLIEANCAWAISRGRGDIHIGIADTDFELTHEDLKNQFASVGGVVSGGATHGTLVSGIAGAETNNALGIASIGYKSKIAACRIVHTKANAIGASASPSAIRDAIWTLYQVGVPVINVSWTTTGLDPAAALEITQNGTVLVLAAGNSPISTNHSAIANIPGVINVSSVDINNNHVTSFAHNQWVDICAPGANVFTTFGNNSYGREWGTSLSAPFVAGTIALMLDVNPCLTPSEIELLIKQSADTIANGASYIGLLGAGRLNAYKSVKIAGTRKYNDIVFYGDRNLSAGFGFDLTNVKIDNGANINLTARKEVVVNGNFEVPVGSTLVVDIDPEARTNCE